MTVPPRALVVDVGTSSVRASVVDDKGEVTHTRRVEVLPVTPAQGLVEIDAVAIAAAVVETAAAVRAEAGDIECVGVTNQRATTVVWDAQTGEPVGPGIGWQDLRTVIDCLVLQADGLRLAPNASATKARWLVQQADPGLVASRRLRFGTIDSWVAWTLSSGALHVTDATNAAVTGLVDPTGSGWDPHACEVLGLDASLLPRIVDTAGALGDATVLAGSPPITAIVGDQQASLAGQGCVAAGDAKLTFGTGAMLDLIVSGRPSFAPRGSAGCFPIVASRIDASTTWGLEAMVLTAGSCIEWLRDDLGLIDDARDTERLAASVPDSGGVSFVPALLGIGTPEWDFGARGGFFGLTRGSTRAHLVRAVLEGIAQRGLDLVEAAELDGGVSLGTLRVDGGMTQNPMFVQLLADVTGRPVAVSSELEATTRGAGLLALLGHDDLATLDSVAATWRPKVVVEPTGDGARREASRSAWRTAKQHCLRTIPDLSDVAF